jgi:hypothetical protein
MKMRLGSLVVLACLALLSACATPSIPYDRGATPAVQTIGVLSVKPPNTPVVVLASTVGRSFGLIGALVDAGMMQARDTHFREMLDLHQYSGPEHFSTYVREAVAAQNYQVSDQRYQRISDEYLPDYKALNGADAWLDCAHFGWG